MLTITASFEPYSRVISQCHLKQRKNKRHGNWKRCKTIFRWCESLSREPEKINTNNKINIYF